MILIFQYNSSLNCKHWIYLEEVEISPKSLNPFKEIEEIYLFYFPTSLNPRVGPAHLPARYSNMPVNCIDGSAVVSKHLYSFGWTTFTQYSRAIYQVLPSATDRLICTLPPAGCRVELPVDLRMFETLYSEHKLIHTRLYSHFLALSVLVAGAVESL